MVSPIPGYDILFNETFIHRDIGDHPVEIDSVQYLSDYISAFMIIRIYFFFKCRFNYS